MPGSIATPRIGRSRLLPGQKILVCDIGGGTSDFTLIRVNANESSGDVQFNRMAVGEHLILGGDNLDLALARHVEQKLVGNDKLPAHQWEVLVRTARRVKETLLGENPPDAITINLPAAGSKLIGGGLQIAVTRTEVRGTAARRFLAARRSGRKAHSQAVGLPGFWIALRGRPGDHALSGGVPFGTSIHRRPNAPARLAREDS